MRKLLPFVLAAAAFMAAAPSWAARAAQQQPDLTASERTLVEGSRAAVIATGLTPAYFDRHFRVERVVDRPGDRRVVWRFSVSGYEATVSDSVGFYTEGGRRFDTHSIAGTLNATSDLTRTIPRARAERIMRRCIGRFTNPQVEYRAQGPGREAALLLTAEAIRSPRVADGREARERRKRARQESQGSGRQADAIGEDDDGGGAVVILGAVDLSNGRCTAGRGQAGPPVAPRRGLR